MAAVSGKPIVTGHPAPQQGFKRPLFAATGGSAGSTSAKAGGPGAPALKKAMASSGAAVAPAKVGNMSAGDAPAAKSLAPSTAATAKATFIAGPGKTTTAAGLSDAVISSVVRTIREAPGNAKIRSVVQLANAVGEALPMEHIDRFLRVLKTRVVQRAQGEGVDLQANEPVRIEAAATQPPANETAPLALAAPLAKAPVGKELAAVGGGATAAKLGGAARPVGGSAVAPARQPKVSQPPPEVKLAQSIAPAISKAGQDLLTPFLSQLDATPVCTDGKLSEARLAAVLKQLWDGAAQTPKDWAIAWQAMNIPVDKQATALQKLLNMTFMQANSSGRAALVVAELVKAHRVKLRRIEEVLVTSGENLKSMLVVNKSVWQVYAHFLVHVFPKPADSGWGWSRVGWSWQSWWHFCEQCVKSLEATLASDVLCLILRLIQQSEGQPIAQVQPWSEADALQRVVTKLSELGACEQSEVVQKLSGHGIDVGL
mmetsp:Transcript_93547/g.235664  ORF Transcript_93547/g.235664 Transcript_93547/m.235664 type:complete len:485 (-) Transcript_93547:139-1593(-)